MAALVQFLASGVNGAANGSATFVLRGTASSAASVLYNDFEMTAQPGTNIITLDANGSAEVYTDAYVDVTLKTSAGVTLRTVTFGNAATTTEVISDSFTGTDYSGSPTAASEPITLAAVLNKWNNSAGTLDWQVLVDGVATNLSSAFASVAGLVFNVKNPTYGAVGDGSTDDTNAINAAITAAVAAGGGIVYFPPSTSFYVFSSLDITAANITLMGAGPRASVLRSSTTATSPIIFSDNTSTGWKRMIGLGLQGTGANANALFQFENNQNLLVQNCDFSATTYTGPYIRRTSTSGYTFANFINCRVTAGASNTSVFINAANDGSVGFKVTDCYVSVPSGFTGDIFAGPDFNVSGCIIDASAVTSGVYTHVAATSNQVAGRYIGRFVNNTFFDGGSAGLCFDLTSIASASDFYEDSNRFSGFTAPSVVTTADNIYSVSHNAQDAYRVYLGSRQGRTLEITHASTGTTTMFSGVSYECLFINYTGAGNVTFQAPHASLTNGSRLMVTVHNNSGAQRDVVVDCGESVQTYGNNGGSDVTVQPNDGERAVFIFEFMHFGTGSPLAFLQTMVED